MTPRERDLAAAKARAEESTKLSLACFDTFKNAPENLSVLGALTLALNRVTAPRDRLHVSFLELELSDPLQAESRREEYGTAIDELDKVVFAFRLYIDKYAETQKL